MIGKVRSVLQRLELASEYGLSLEKCGREWLLVIPRSASSSATDLDVIEVPRSACSVSSYDGYVVLAAVSPMKSCANSAVSREPNHPADDVAAEDVEDDVEVEVGPFRWAAELGDIPTPDLVRTVARSSGLTVDGMPRLSRRSRTWATARSSRYMGWHRTQVGPFIQQRGVDTRRCRIEEGLSMQDVEHRAAFGMAQRPRLRAPPRGLCAL